jgi:hypothetical protein
MHKSKMQSSLWLRNSTESEVDAIPDKKRIHCITMQVVRGGRCDLPSILFKGYR